MNPKQSVYSIHIEIDDPEIKGTVSLLLSNIVLNTAENTNHKYNKWNLIELIRNRITIEK